MLLGIIRLLVARHRGNPPAVAEEARKLQAAAEAPEAMQPGLGEELRALALISLGSAEYGAARIEDAAAHLEQGAVLASRVGRPLEFTGLAYQAQVELERSFARAAERGRQAVSWPNGRLDRRAGRRKRLHRTRRRAVLPGAAR